MLPLPTRPRENGSEVHIPTLQSKFVPNFIALSLAVCPVRRQYTDTQTFSFIISREKHFLGEGMDLFEHSSSGPHIASCTQYYPCPLSPDTTHVTFFLLDYLNSQSYPGWVPTLKDNISRAVLSIADDMLRSSVENVMYKMRVDCRCPGCQSWGAFFNH
ncbi:hypothetical protein AVEN_115528-1 [Araneus ventricosus]|uniref:START domain-containing protein n=1 Tax=Araneus ventricosus TaxID=182803 RepID=A0A4Y2CJN4_ARAVE|nr:hypothetical protein AVEN_115528-1 [Araneus ventricosus]